MRLQVARRQRRFGALLAAHTLALMPCLATACAQQTAVRRNCQPTNTLNRDLLIAAEAQPPVQTKEVIASPVGMIDRDGFQRYLGVDPTLSALDTAQAAGAIRFQFTNIGGGKAFLMVIPRATSGTRPTHAYQVAFGIHPRTENPTLDSFVTFLNRALDQQQAILSEVTTASLGPGFGGYDFFAHDEPFEFQEFAQQRACSPGDRSAGWNTKYLFGLHGNTLVAVWTMLYGVPDLSYQGPGGGSEFGFGDGKFAIVKEWSLGAWEVYWYAIGGLQPLA